MIAMNVNLKGMNARKTMYLTGPVNLHKVLCNFSRDRQKYCRGGTYAWEVNKKWPDKDIWGGPGAPVVNVVDGVDGDTFQMVECTGIVNKIKGYTATHD
jgi:hypothetical protein